MFAHTTSKTPLPQGGRGTTTGSTLRGELIGTALAPHDTLEAVLRQATRVKEELSLKLAGVASEHKGSRVMGDPSNFRGYYFVTITVGRRNQDHPQFIFTSSRRAYSFLRDPRLVEHAGASYRADVKFPTIIGEAKLDIIRLLSMIREKVRFFR